MKSLQTGSEDGGSNFWMIFFTKAGRFQHQMDLMELAGWLQVVFLLVFFPHETSIKRIQFFSHWNTIIQTVFPHETRIMSGFWRMFFSAGCWGAPAKRLKHGAEWMGKQQESVVNEKVYQGLSRRDCKKLSHENRGLWLLRVFLGCSMGGGDSPVCS